MRARTRIPVVNVGKRFSPPRPPPDDWICTICTVVPAWHVDDHRRARRELEVYIRKKPPPRRLATLLTVFLRLLTLGGRLGCFSVPFHAPEVVWSCRARARARARTSTAAFLFPSCA